MHGDLDAPGINDAARANFLHVSLPNLGIELVGVRAPAYETASEKRDYWAALSAIVASRKDRPIIFMGDLNTNPDGKSPIDRTLASIELSGWQVPRPPGPYSWRDSEGKHSRIDYAICAPAFGYATASYLTHFNGKEIVGSGRHVVSDHPALVLDIPIPSGPI